MDLIFGWLLEGLAWLMGKTGRYRWHAVFVVFLVTSILACWWCLWDAELGPIWEWGTDRVATFGSQAGALLVFAIIVGGVTVAAVAGAVEAGRDPEIVKLANSHGLDYATAVELFAELPKAGRETQETAQAEPGNIRVIGEVIAIVFAWGLGVFVGSGVFALTFSTSFFWLGENFFRILDAMSGGGRYGFCCTLPVLAVSLFILWAGHRESKADRAGLVYVLFGAIIALVGGFVSGAFGILEWYH